MVFLYLLRMGKGHLRGFSPFTFSRVFLSTEPASLVATHMKSPLWLADAELIMRAPSSLAKNSDCSGWISRPFLNQRIFGRGEPECTGATKWFKFRFGLASALGCSAYLQQAGCSMRRRRLDDNLKCIKIYYRALRWESQGLGTQVFQRTGQSQAGIKQVCFCWLLGAQRLQMTERKKRGTTVAYCIEYCSQKKMNISGSSTVGMTSSDFKSITSSIRAEIDKTAPFLSTVPFCTYVYSYGLLKKNHCLILRRKCVQMFWFRCLTDVIKGLWIYLYGLKKMMSSICFFPIITSITCYALIGN